MLSNLDSHCRFCSKIFCCSKCREIHESESHSLLLDKIALVDFYFASDNLFLLKPSEKNNILQHILCHTSIQCLKCLKIFIFTTDIKNFSKCNAYKNKHTIEFNVKHNNTECLQTKNMESENLTSDIKFRSIFNIAVKNNHNVEATSIKNLPLKNNSVQNVDNDVLRNVKLVRTTSTPMQEFLFNFYENNGSHYVSSIYSSENNPDSIKTDLTYNERLSKLSDQICKDKGKKIEVITESLHTPFISNSSEDIIYKSINNFSVDKFYKRCNEMGSPLDLRTSDVLHRNKNCISTRVFYAKSPSGSCKIKQCYTISSKKTESIVVKSSLLRSTPASIRCEEDINIYSSCKSLKLISSEKVETKKYELQKKINCPLQLTPKYRGTLKRKTIDFKIINDCSELSDDENFYTPNKTVNKSTAFQRKNADDSSKLYTTVTDDSCNKENFGKRIWGIFSSIIRFPSFNTKENQNLESKVDPVVSTEKQADIIQSGNENFSIKRKRNSSEDIHSHNEIKRPKFVYSRRPLDGYKLRIRSFNNTEN